MGEAEAVVDSAEDGYSDQELAELESEFPPVAASDESFDGSEEPLGEDHAWNKRKEKPATPDADTTPDAATTEVEEQPEVPAGDEAEETPELESAVVEEIPAVEATTPTTAEIIDVPETFDYDAELLKARDTAAEPLLTDYNALIGQLAEVDADLNDLRTELVDRYGAEIVNSPKARKEMSAGDRAALRMLEGNVVEIKGKIDVLSEKAKANFAKIQDSLEVKRAIHSSKGALKDAGAELAVLSNPRLIHSDQALVQALVKTVREHNARKEAKTAVNSRAATPAQQKEIDRKAVEATLARRGRAGIGIGSRAAGVTAAAAAGSKEADTIFKKFKSMAKNYEAGMD